MQVIEELKKKQAKTAASIKAINAEIEKIWKAIDALKKLVESTQNMVETIIPTTQQLLNETDELRARLKKLEDKGKIRIRVLNREKKKGGQDGTEKKS
ncbi:hypothetical protein DRZ78_00085 [Candidatus Aerophobetes bacterium]|mgnify:CR=1 FL=1|uniref:Conserved oligomeric complex COG6 N-terminal domain-containing protein n=1 Tax=Aerophobetes bacterium TaxID=2030807 RepID=A0A662D7F1_UNCAE|nr:MAG: hypothetical protein DRZ78_00085 [Candidatus Aerophobetes bacterium]